MSSRSVSFDRRRLHTRALPALLSLAGVLVPALASAQDPHYDAYAARYTASGSFDSGWNGTGVVQSTTPGADDARDTAVDSAGRVISCATYTDAEDVIHLIVGRFNSNGSADTSFGWLGVTTAGNPDHNISTVSCAVDSSNRIVVLAEDDTAPTTARVYRFAANGALDTTFGSQGVSGVIFLGAVLVEMEDLTLSSTGKIAFTGRRYDGSTNDVVVVQLTPSGALDTTFSGDGSAVTDLGTNFDAGMHLTYDSSGRIVVVAEKSTAAAGSSLSVLRYTTAGNLDTGWGGTGKVSLTFAGYDHVSGGSVAIDASGRVVVAGVAWSVGGTGVFATARYTSTGVLDTGWSGDGKHLTSIAGGVSPFYDTEILVGSDGKVRVGSTTDDDTLVWKIGLVRYTSAGALDTTFSGDGKLTSSMPGYPMTSLGAMALDSAGRLVVVGAGHPPEQ